MGDLIKVVIKTPEQVQSEKDNQIIGTVALISLVIMIVLGYYLYKYLIERGLNTNSAIGLMIGIPIILLILIFRWRPIFSAMGSLKKKNLHKLEYQSNRKVGFIWLGIITLIIIVLLILQFFPIAKIALTPQNFNNEDKVVYVNEISPLCDDIKVDMVYSDIIEIGKAKRLVRDIIDMQMGAESQQKILTLTTSNDLSVCKLYFDSNWNNKIGEGVYTANISAKIIKKELYFNGTLVSN